MAGGIAPQVLGGVLGRCPPADLIHPWSEGALPGALSGQRPGGGRANPLCFTQGRRRKNKLYVYMPHIKRKTITLKEIISLLLCHVQLKKVLLLQITY